MSKPTTRQMSDAHEKFLEVILGARRTRGSGNQFVDPMDVKHDDGAWRWAADGKSTFGSSLGVTPAMWEKAVEQSHGRRPILPLRWYQPDDWRLIPRLDLVVVDLHDFAEMVGELRK